MHPTDFAPKLDNSAGDRSQSALRLWPLGVSTAAFFALSWLLRRFTPTSQTMMAWLGVLALAVLFVVWVRQKNIFIPPTKSRLRPDLVESIHVLRVEAKDKTEVVADRQFWTLFKDSNKPDEAWAEAVAAYEGAMQRLAAGRPGSRIEAQTSALELTRLQGLLIRAALPHLPLGL